MDLRLLEIFCAVYEERGFSKAAARLHLTQPTVSGHIKVLEEYFGTPLFDRLGREIQPTRAGELLYEHGQHILTIKKTIREGMSKFLNRLEGKLHLGASTIPGEYLLPPIIGSFHKAYPNVAVAVTISDTQRVIRDVEQGRVELGFVGARTEDGNLSFKKFASDQLVLIAPTSKPWAEVKSISLGDLTKLPMLIRESGSGTRTVLERKLAELGCSLSDFNIVAQLGSTTAIKQAVHADVGVSFISKVAVRHETHCRLVKEVRVRELKTIERDFFVVRNKKRTSSPVCEAFLESVCD
jgi:DNA-binding transcriptional LysR family regulator